MPRPNKVEACMFCGDAPCTCNAKPKTKVTPKKKAEPTPTTKPSVLDAPLSEPPRKVFKVTAKDERPVHDYESVQAVRNLADAGLLADSELHKYRSILKPTLPGELDRRVADWRKRNGLGR